MNGQDGILYGLMANPGHNRVYFEASKVMALAELELACRQFDVPCGNVSAMDVEGIHLVTFRAEAPLSEADLRWVSRLSFVFAVFRMEIRADGVALFPIRKLRTGVMNDDLVTILKYSGKTNELFTRLMVNVGLLSGKYAREPHISLMDPVAGKGTTLFEAAVSGWDAYGVEIGEKPVHEAGVFFKKYLETGKYKHTMERERLSGEGRRFKAVVSLFEFSASKEAQKAGVKQKLCMVEGDSRYADHYFRREQFHVIVGDLPYGVQHGSQTRNNPDEPVPDSPPDLARGSSSSHTRSASSTRPRNGSSAPTRNPVELVRTCLPAWLEVLKPGGTIVLAWNRFVLERQALASAFRFKGLTVLEEAPYDQFLHRVDQAINRDIIVVRKD